VTGYWLDNWGLKPSSSGIFLITAISIPAMGPDLSHSYAAEFLYSVSQIVSFLKGGG